MNFSNSWSEDEFYSFRDYVLLDENERLLVLEWRNHPSIRNVMYNTDIIDVKTHYSFIENLKKTETKKYWLARRKDIYVGSISLVNIKDSQGELGFFLAPAFHKLLSIEFYYYSLRFLFESLGINMVYGFTLIDNASANSLNDLFKLSKKIVEKETNGKKDKFYYREMASDMWSIKIKNDKKIEKLLLLTRNKM